MTIASILNSSKLTFVSYGRYLPLLELGFSAEIGGSLVCSAPHTNGAELEIVKRTLIVNKEKDVKILSVCVCVCVCVCVNITVFIYLHACILTVIVPERVAKLKGLSEPVRIENGIQVVDTLRFFKGDKPAAEFESGISCGGKYPCVGCVCSVSRFADSSYSKLCTSVVPQFGYGNIRHRGESSAGYQYAWHHTLWLGRGRYT